MLTRYAFGIGALLVMGCSGYSAGRPEPVPECEQYESLVRSCTGHDVAIASQPAALASSRADRERLAKLCSFNSRRLQNTCQ